MMTNHAINTLRAQHITIWFSFIWITFGGFFPPCSSLMRNWPIIIRRVSRTVMYTVYRLQWLKFGNMLSTC